MEFLIIVIGSILIGAASIYYEYKKQRPLSDFPRLQADFRFYAGLADMQAKGTVSRAELVRYHADYKSKVAVELAKKGFPVSGDVHF